LGAVDVEFTRVCARTEGRGTALAAPAVVATLASEGELGAALAITGGGAIAFGGAAVFECPRSGALSAASGKAAVWATLLAGVLDATAHEMASTASPRATAIAARMAGVAAAGAFRSASGCRSAVALPRVAIAISTWSRVIDVREMPPVRLQSFANPSMWQVDLDRGERFDFCGTRDARKNVAEYIERAERNAH